MCFPSSLSEQIHESEQYFAIVAAASACPRSRVGFALLLSLVEKLSVTNVPLCELLLSLLNEIIVRSTDENRHFLVDIGIIQVLFNTLAAAIMHSREKIVVHVQKCLNSLITHIFVTSIKEDISFVSIINNIFGMMMLMNYETDDDSERTTRTNSRDTLGRLDASKVHRRVLHQTVSQMFGALADAIEKPHSTEPPTYRSASGRTTTDDASQNPTLVEHCDRFRKFLLLALDYIHSFHDECAVFESFTLRLLNICLIGTAYLIEKRSGSANARHQMTLIMFRCGDTIKQVGQKLLTVALDPARQRFFFRVQVLKHIIDQPNARAIIEHLLANDAQCHIYHQMLISLQTLSLTTPNSSDLEQVNNPNYVEQSRRSADSGHSTLVTAMTTTQTFSNGEESSHTVNISTKSNGPKPTKSTPKRKTSKGESSPSDEEVAASDNSSSSTGDDEQETPAAEIFDRSSSTSLSISSANSDLPIIQPGSMMNYQGIISSFQDLMRSLILPALTSNDSSVAQRRALTDHLLNQPSNTGKFTALFA